MTDFKPPVNRVPNVEDPPNGGIIRHCLTDITKKINTLSASFTASGTISHGSLSGLGNDDHPQYLLLAGRSYQDNVTASSTSVTPIKIVPFPSSTVERFLVTDSDGSTKRLAVDSNARVQVNNAAGAGLFNISANAGNSSAQIGTTSGFSGLFFSPSSTGMHIALKSGSAAEMVGIFERDGGSIDPTWKFLGQMQVLPYADDVALNLSGANAGTADLVQLRSTGLAGTLVAKVGHHGDTYVNPDADVVGIQVNQFAGATSRLIQLRDSATNEVFAVQGDTPALDLPVYATYCKSLQINPGGPGSGASATLDATSISTANRTFNFPDNNGQFLVRVGNVTVAPRTTSTSGTIVAAGSNPSGQSWLINGHVYCTVAGTGSVQVSITFTDTVGSYTTTVATLSMTSTAAPGRAQFFSLVARTTPSSAITYATTVVTTGTYTMVIRASGM